MNSKKSMENKLTRSIHQSTIKLAHTHKHIIFWAHLFAPRTKKKIVATFLYEFFETKKKFIHFQAFSVFPFNIICRKNNPATKTWLECITVEHEETKKFINLSALRNCDLKTRIERLNYFGENRLKKIVQEKKNLQKLWFFFFGWD